MTEDGLKLSRTHNYYFQIQGQMATCEQSYTDFVCWIPYGMHIGYIFRDDEHFSQRLTLSLLTVFFLVFFVEHLKMQLPTRRMFYQMN